MNWLTEDPWAASSPELGSGFYGVMETPSYTKTPSFNTAVQNYSSTPEAPISSPSSSWSLPSFDSGKFLSGLANIVDFGLKTNAAIKGAEIAVKNQELQGYLAKSQFEILRDKAQADIAIGKENSLTNRYLAQAKSAAALSGQNAVNFGTQGGGGVMLWLTVLGVVFAGIQVIKSAK